MKLGGQSVRVLVAEMIGTFWLVFASLGAALFAAGVANVGIGWLGVSVAFGLTIVTMAYAIGPISGCHLNPAVTLGLAIGGRVERSSVLPYIAAQCAGGLLGALLLLAIGNGGMAPFDLSAAANGYGIHSPQGYGLVAVFLAEFVLTGMFLFIIMGATSPKAPAGFAPLAIGLCLTLIHLVAIPISNTSVNPARSLGIALFDGHWWSLGQLWLFIIAPLAGGVCGAILYRYVAAEGTLEMPHMPDVETLKKAPGAAMAAIRTATKDIKDDQEPVAEKPSDKPKARPKAAPRKRKTNKTSS